MRRIVYILFLLNAAHIVAQKNYVVIARLQKEYDAAYQFTGDDYLEVVNWQNHTYGAYDVEGKLLIPCISEYPVDLDVNTQTGFVTKNGKKALYSCKEEREVTAYIYDKKYTGHMSLSGYYHVCKDGKKGLISSNGDEIFPCIYEKITNEYTNENTNRIRQHRIYYTKKTEDSTWGLAHIDRGVLIPGGIYDWMIPIEECEYAIVVKCRGAEIKYRWDERGYFADYQNIHPKYGLWDWANDKEVVPCKYNWIGMYGEDLFVFNVGGEIHRSTHFPTGGRFGYIDKNGKEVVPAIYDNAARFQDGVAQVTKDGVASIIVHPVVGTDLYVKGQKGSMDLNIPVSAKMNHDTFAFIISNENYLNHYRADFAINDGKVFREYCQKTLGIPETNIHYYEDATYGSIINAIGKIKDLAEVYEGEAKIIFYYAGLGGCDEKTKERYLLPVDASIQSVGTTGIDLNNVYKQLAEFSTKYTLAIIDAPFSNTDRVGESITAERGIVAKTNKVIPQGNVIMYTSSGEGQPSYVDRNFRHGLMTGLFLQKLHFDKGGSSIQSVLNYATKEVKREALTKHERLQEPQLVVTDEMKKKMQTLKF